MSVVSNVILKTFIGEHGAMEELEKRCRDYCWFTGRFVTVDDAYVNHVYPGSKYLECDIYPAAFNYFCLNELLTAIEAVRWRYPEYVQVFVQEEDANIMVEEYRGGVRYRV